MDNRVSERAINRLLAPLARRVLMMVARVVLTQARDHAPVQAVQISLLADEVKDNVEYLQAFGFSSVAPAGARGVAVFPAGDRSHGVVLVLDDRKRQPKALAAGESMLWDMLGKFIHLRADGSLHIKAPRIVLDADDIVVLAANRHRLDVNGYAEELRKSGAGYQRETWSTGAVFDPQIDNPIAPPRSEDP
ncbi:phage baseplate assembly protein V [Ferrovibrio xuzhouensis]|uniref:Phage baseplate assembly protein V n=1 Tax=Ferrovibrio xuzhouensis TaxID=1576914 RepID=A0ABV7VB08_9PROT